MTDYYAYYELVEIDTADGTQRFIIGADAKFTDANGNLWVGSTILKRSALSSVIGGAAPEGSLQMAYFQDPSQPNLQASIEAQGPDYLVGREIRFYIQDFAAAEEREAPVTPPELQHTRTMRSIIFDANGVLGREITIKFEAWTSARNNRKLTPFSRAGHEAILGEVNPSLEFRPTDNRPEETTF